MTFELTEQQEVRKSRFFKCEVLDQASENDCVESGEFS